MARILLIDDDELTLDLVGRMLSEMGQDVFPASDGNLGLEVLRSEMIELVITDILMPNKEGIETIREIHLSYPGIRVIAISGGHGAVANSANLFTASKFGAQGVLEKPFTAEQLSQVLRSVLGEGAAPA
jgi:DNA-binding NtrC family response regulator